MSIGVRVITEDIKKPLLDDRLYRRIRLANDLEALLIHDAATDKAAAALSVNVGSFSNPDDLPGLAHFLEHLLFLGTVKYPEENSYHQYLSDHSGIANAYTSSEETNYIFEVGHEYLDGALDMFSQFFIAPLFSADGTDRELRAVDSENKKNLQSDTWRMNQLCKSLGNPNHPYSRFGTGNKETLGTIPSKAGVDVRARLIEFYKNHYSSNLMKLVVLGRESLDELQDMVASKFCNVPNHLHAVPSFGSDPLVPENFGKTIKAVPIKDEKHMLLTWLVPDQYDQYLVKPGRYAGHLLGHEAPGSLHYHFKEKGWVTATFAGTQHVTKGADFFLIDYELTSTGIDNYELILRDTFKYIEMVKKEGPQKWIWSEKQQMSDMNFKFTQKRRAYNTVENLASQMQRPYPPEKLLSHGLMEKYDAKMISDFWQRLSMDSFRVLISSQTFSDLPQKEQWYGTEYSVEATDLQKLIAEVKGETDGHLVFYLPKVNEFISTNFDLLPHTPGQNNSLKQPTLLKRLNHAGSLISVWHKKDETFGVPKSEVNIAFKTILAQSTPLNSVKTSMYVDLLMDHLVQFGYYAEIAGLNYDITTTKNGFAITATGYSDKLNVLVEKIVADVGTFEIKSSRFDVMKEKNILRLKNFEYNIPYTQVTNYAHFIINDHAWAVKDKLEALKAVTAADLKQYQNSFFKEVNVEILLNGNVAKESAQALGDYVGKMLKSSSLPVSVSTGGRNIVLAPGEHYRFEKLLEDPNQLNSCIEYVMMIGKISDRRLRCIVELIAQITQEPAYTRLRTKEQLGYVVFSGMRCFRVSCGYRVLIQSERDCRYLEERIEAFLSYFSKILNNLSQEDFDRQVQSVVDKKLEKAKNLREETSRFWTEIMSEYYDFTERESDADILKTISLQEVKDVYMKYIDPSSATRSVLSVHLNSQRPPALTYYEKVGTGVVNAALANDIDFSAKEILEFGAECEGKDIAAITSLLRDRLQQRGIAAHLISKMEADIMQELQNVTRDREPKGELIGAINKFKESHTLTECQAPIYDLSSFMEADIKL